MAVATGLSLSRPVAVAPHRVVVIDDSVVARVMLTQTLAEERDFEVCAAFDSAGRALNWLQTIRCDLILLDLQMPGCSGIAALPDLIRAGRGARIVVVSSTADAGATTTLQALSLGAADVIAKPSSGPIGKQFCNDLISRLRGLVAEAAIIHERPEKVAVRTVPASPIACVGIGASTGGINAVTRLLAAVPKDFDAPILITQHLPAPFIPFFAAQIAKLCQRPCTVARSGDVIRARTILIAPGEGHLGLVCRGSRVVVSILRNPVASRCLPSVDPMFEGIGRCYGANGVGIVLSGMGRDGCEGAGSLVRSGGSILAQDAESSTIWGMPGSVARAGIASVIASPERIAAHLSWRGSAP